MLRLLTLLGALALATACSEGAPSDGTGGGGGAGAESNAGTGASSEAGSSGASAADPSVELGVPAGDDGLDFEALQDGDELRLQTFGQGGTHVLVAVRCIGFDKRSFISATLRNLVTDQEVEEPAPARPQLLYCHDAVCDLVPYLVHASGLTGTNEEKSGLNVRLTARVRSEAGVMAEASRDLVLSTADL